MSAVLFVPARADPSRVPVCGREPGFVLPNNTSPARVAGEFGNRG